MSRLKPTRLFAVIGLATAQLRRSPGRTIFAVLAVALAVLSVTLFISLGIGVVEVGQESVQGTDRDVWISADPVDSSPGGTENGIVESHTVAADVHQHEDVRRAAPVAIHSTYVGTNPEELESVTTVGLPQTHGGFEFDEGEGFDADEDVVAELASPERDVSDPGAPSPTDDVEPTDVVIDPDLASALGVSVGETMYVAPSPNEDAARAYTVVGTADRYSQFVGEPTVVMRLHELQYLAGSRGADRASFITLDLESGADPEAVRDDVAADYPEYTVQTADEQFWSMLEDHALVVVSGAALVVLAIVGGIVLTANLFVLVAYQQREQLAALSAVGLSRPLLAGIVGFQGLVIALLGGLVAIAATGPIVHRLNSLAYAAVGFDGLLQTPLAVYAAGALVAVGVGTITALVAGWSASRYASVARMQA
ncbi:ABC transporter permease [Halovivax gelatinilyticus]|uniref:ABC transporter permease n=1 Tax=Halovivax gelatinilyticus TaxID=2961597 RepID=UPI0020CA6E3E|nr:ABC transporter permease [Halovivax gelatinilyticus]